MNHTIEFSLMILGMALILLALAPLLEKIQNRLWAWRDRQTGAIPRGQRMYVRIGKRRLPVEFGDDDAAGSARSGS